MANAANTRLVSDTSAAERQWKCVISYLRLARMYLDRHACWPQRVKPPLIASAVPSAKNGRKGLILRKNAPTPATLMRARPYGLRRPADQYCGTKDRSSGRSRRIGWFVGQHGMKCATRAANRVTPGCSARTALFRLLLLAAGMEAAC
jgi:hypothetical protein